MPHLLHHLLNNCAQRLSLQTKQSCAKRCKVPDLVLHRALNRVSELRICHLTLDWLSFYAVSEVSEPITYYPLVEKALSTLMENPAFILNDSDVLHGYLGYQANDPAIGIGAFKTAHHARLTLNPPANGGLGVATNEHVVMKRPYYNKGRSKDDQPLQHRIARYSVTDELTKVLVEANILMWASCLMSVTYGFIDRFLEKSSQPPPFFIPRLRFVQAGIAVAQQAINRRSTAHAGYLLEEYIDPSVQGPFIKYIHNTDAVLLSDENEEGYNIALFLCFAQHVQYTKTGCATYVSDFQGMLQAIMLHV